MKKFMIICIVVMLLGSVGFKKNKGPRYTAYNIWNHRGVLACINYKLGERIIPAGTQVKRIKIVNKNGERLIVFRIAESNEIVSVSFTPRWHPGHTIKSFAKKMFTKKTFDHRSRKLNSKEIQSIKKGVVTTGMSKRAVLISYGPPPEHRTPNLDGDRWIYWLDKRRMKTICFDEAERAIGCSEVSPDRL